MSEEKDFREMGYPYTVPMNFVYANGHIYFHSALEGHKIDAVRSSPNACFTIINEPVKEENERTAKLRHLGQKYFPDGYDLNADLMQNGPRVAVLDFNIEHINGKKVKEN